jgi:hypothetical protein
MRSSSAVRSVVLALAVSFVPAASQAGVIVSITVAPPIMPVYVQPICPQIGYLWTPGYWAYGDEGYFWVPGAWMAPPSVGLLWTPGYWGWNSGVYAWNAGYWGPHVGFYGGVNYGFGYGGVGFLGGRWEGGHFAYNAEVAHVGVGFSSYHENVVVNNVHTSFNGGAGGLSARPTPGERAAMGEHHVGPTAAQASHHEMAGHDRGNLASVNHGRPANAAMSRAGAAHAENRAAAAHAENHAAAAHAENHAAASHGAENHGGAANHGGPADKGGAHNAAASHPGPANHSAAPANHAAAPANHAAPASHAAAPANHSSGGAKPAGGGGKPAAGKK